MDSFFSLFDPSDGKQNKQTDKQMKTDDDTVKKKDGPKGRRRGRRNPSKHEYLPEESSFLCEPELGNEVLVRDASYIDSYIKRATATDAEQRLKRRNSNRKMRRKRNKVSPAKEAGPSTAWSDTETASWNNRATYPRLASDHVGKLVNDLSDKSTNPAPSMPELVKRLDKVTLKGARFLPGELEEQDLDNYSLSSSDDDYESESDDASMSEVTGCLPPEPRFGNVEYKLQLVNPGEKRFQHLVTQLKWRLASGGGSAVYVLGVDDDGSLRGLRPRALRASLRTLQRMCGALGAETAHMRARRVCAHRAVLELHIRSMTDTEKSVELRVAVMGANEAGKSTLIGVLTQGELDNGRGSARLNMFRHVHEVKSGRTSSLSHEILGFDSGGNVVNYGCSELMTAERIGERSAKLVSFLDLAGHSKYQRTTVHGLSGYCPHVAMLLISASSGVTRITEEHIALLLALKLPFFLVLSKCEVNPGGVQTGLQRAQEILAPHGKKPVLISDEESLTRFCLAPQKLILDSLDNEDSAQDEPPAAGELIPVFPVSAVRGCGLRALHAYLLALQPPKVPTHHMDEDTCEFQIDEVFHVEESTGAVVGGLLLRGSIARGDLLLIGPLASGEFQRTRVRSIQRHGARAARVRAGQCAALALSHAARARPGHVLLKVKKPSDTKTEETETPENRKKTRRKEDNLLNDLKQVERILAKDNIDEANIYKPEDDETRKSDLKLIKSDVNLIKSDANLFKSDVESIKSDASLIKSDIDADLFKSDEGLMKSDVNLIKSDESLIKSKTNMVEAVTKEVDSPRKGDSEVDSDEITAEDPYNPRGCMFFQATVEILRHATSISAGFQCTVHVGNVRQTAIIEGILSHQGALRAGQRASCVFRFARSPEFLVRGRRLLFTQGQGTRAIGRITQVFPFVP